MGVGCLCAKGKKDYIARQKIIAWSGSVASLRFPHTRERFDGDLF